ncbi:MAG: hypothetical protein HGB11_11670 [Chlorobiales bacterium]|nr:hypothetical protein [Chlorobiales bacterium]
MTSEKVKESITLYKSFQDSLQLVSSDRFKTQFFMQTGSDVWQNFVQASVKLGKTEKESYTFF